MKQWILCGGLCVLLGACSTLGLANHRKGVAPSTPPSNLVNHSIANQKFISPTPAIQAHYRSSSQSNTVHDLPDAMDYLIDKNRQWVDELESAPAWTRTPEELAPSPYKIQPPAPQERGPPRE